LDALVQNATAAGRRLHQHVDEFAALNATVAGDAAAVEDPRHAFRFFDADGNGTISTTKLAPSRASSEASASQRPLAFLDDIRDLRRRGHAPERGDGGRHAPARGMVAEADEDVARHMDADDIAQSSQSSTLA
jgi:hypothetical protein